MQPWALWQEIRWLLGVEDLSASMAESLEAVTKEVSAFLARHTGIKSGEPLSQAAIERLRIELDPPNPEKATFEAMQHCESQRFHLAFERCSMIIDLLEENIDSSKDVRVIQRFEDFLVRFQRYRAKQIISQYYPPESAERIAAMIDATPDFRKLKPLPPEMADATEQEMVKFWLSSYPASVKQSDYRVTFFQPFWHCVLEYDTEEEAELACDFFRQRYSRSRGTAATLRTSPTAENLLVFLSKTAMRHHPPSSLTLEIRGNAAE